MYPQYWTPCIGGTYQKLRRTFLVAISHCSISLYPLNAICKLQICSEAYAQLLWYAATNDCFTLLDIRLIFRELLQKTGGFVDALII